MNSQTGLRWSGALSKMGLGAGLAAALVLSAPAAAREVTVLRTVTVDTHYTEPPGEGKVDCSFAGEPACFAGYSYFTGTFAGTGYYELAGGPDAQGNITYEGPERITGSIRGCGSGSFILDITDGKIYSTRFDPATQSAPGYNKWHVRRGSGTGGLTGLESGSGENHWTAYPSSLDPAARHFGEGHFTGEVRCRVKKRHGPGTRPPGRGSKRCKGRAGRPGVRGGGGGGCRRG